MPPPTPHITLTANLLDYSGATVGTATQPSWLRIALCGFGPTLPAVGGAGNLAKISSWFLDIPYSGTTLSVSLWGNDQITPPGTYYAISILDANKNVVQTAAYVFTGTTTIDLSTAVPVAPPAPPQIFNLVMKTAAGTVPGTVFTLPTPVLGTVLGVWYRGVYYDGTNYTQAAGSQTITMNFACTEAPVALYVQALA